MCEITNSPSRNEEDLTLLVSTLKNLANKIENPDSQISRKGIVNSNKYGSHSRLIENI